MTANQETLRREILERSRSKDWDAALAEWDLHRIEFTSLRDPEVCLCGHFPIIELCYLLNRHNGVEVLVGNVCVQRFLGIPSEKLFRGAKRIMLDPTKATSRDVIEHAHRQKWISDWEREFSESVVRKRKLSSAQLGKRIEINQRIAQMVAAARMNAATKIESAKAKVLP
jgi:hypothetical protein